MIILQNETIFINKIYNIYMVDISIIKKNKNQRKWTIFFILILNFFFKKKKKKKKIFNFFIVWRKNKTNQKLKFKCSIYYIIHIYYLIKLF